MITIVAAATYESWDDPPLEGSQKSTNFFSQNKELPAVRFAGQNQTKVTQKQPSLGDENPTSLLLGLAF